MLTESLLIGQSILQVLTEFLLWTFTLDNVLGTLTSQWTMCMAIQSFLTTWPVNGSRQGTLLLCLLMLAASPGPELLPRRYCKPSAWSAEDGVQHCDFYAHEAPQMLDVSANGVLTVFCDTHRTLFCVLNQEHCLAHTAPRLLQLCLCHSLGLQVTTWGCQLVLSWLAAE